MKKILPVLFLVLFFLNSINAQEENKPADWQIFQPPQEEFSVELPQAVTNKSFFDKGTLASGFYAVQFNKNYYFVRSANVKNNLAFESLKNYISANPAHNSSESVNGLDANVYRFQDKDGYYNRIMEIQTNQRTYFFHTFSETENDSDVDRFFKSIALSENAKGSSPQTRQKAEGLRQTEKFDLPIPTGSGSGIGSGSGLSAGSGVGIGNGKTEAEKQNSPLKILSKPRVSYTDLARQYWIQGSVRLRVTFLENGQIGEVIPLTKLPFGLTRNSLDVARQIRFEPAVKDSKPTTVSKIVEYTFTLY